MTVDRVKLRTLHHVQLAMPKGGEAQARAFYGEVLGLSEVLKPKALAGRGGVWFEDGDLRVHLGVEDPFVPARKAHPAFEVTDLIATRVALEPLGVTEVSVLPGLKRFYTHDPFGNRIEMVELD